MNSPRVITCILPKGVAVPLLRDLKDQFGIVTANITNASGVGKSAPLTRRGVGARSEKEILSMVVTALQADEVFEFIYHKAEIDRPHGGLVYQARLGRCTVCVLPDLPQED